jgi:hypothetical protein
MKNLTGALALFLLLVHAASAEAKVVEQDKAFRVASGFVAAHSNGLRSASSIELVYTATAAAGLDEALRSLAGRPLFYVYNVQGKAGFVMVSADDNAIPILAYAAQGEFEPDNMPGNLKSWLSVYEKEISGLAENENAAAGEALAGWDVWLKAATRAPSAVVLLPTAEWDQTEPYNNLCPEDGPGRALAGCVATAMGVIMKYHQWPEKGTGSHSYTTQSLQIPLSADFNVAYDWDNMPDAYNRRWSAAQRQAVATLIYHCGVAANMDYTYEASGSSGWDASRALTDYFGFDQGLSMICRDLYTTAEWYDLLRNELNENRPLLYGGNTKDEEGHLFVIDGYDSQDYFHVNWGWSGIANGYYQLSALEPTQQGAGGSREGEGYDFLQDAIIGLQKATRLSQPNHEFYFPEAGDFDVYGLSTDVDVITRDRPFKLRFSYVFDYGRRDFDGAMGFFVVDSNGYRKTELETFRYRLEAGYGLYDDVGETYTLASEIEKGDKIRMFYNSNGRQWKPVRGTQHTVVELPLGTPLPVSVEAPAAIPHPTQATVDEGNLRILLADGEALREARLFSLSGRLLETFRPSALSGAQPFFPLYNIPSGIYIISIHLTKNAHSYRRNHIFLNK